MPSALCSTSHAPTPTIVMKVHFSTSSERSERNYVLEKLVMVQEGNKNGIPREFASYVQKPKGLLPVPL